MHKSLEEGDGGGIDLKEREREAERERLEEVTSSPFLSKSRVVFVISILHQSK